MRCRTNLHWFSLLGSLLFFPLSAHAQEACSVLGKTCKYQNGVLWEFLCEPYPDGALRMTFLGTQCPAVNTQPQQGMSYAFTFANQSTYTVTLFVNGKRECANTAPGRSCMILLPGGTYNMVARTTQGHESSRQVLLDDVKTWTISNR